MEYGDHRTVRERVDGVVLSFFPKLHYKNSLNCAVLKMALKIC